MGRIKKTSIYVSMALVAIITAGCMGGGVKLPPYNPDSPDGTRKFYLTPTWTVDIIMAIAGDVISNDGGVIYKSSISRNQVISVELDHRDEVTDKIACWTNSKQSPKQKASINDVSKDGDALQTWTIEGVKEGSLPARSVKMCMDLDTRTYEYTFPSMELPVTKKAYDQSGLMQSSTGEDEVPGAKNILDRLPTEFGDGDLNSLVETTVDIQPPLGLVEPVETLISAAFTAGAVII